MAERRIAITYFDRAGYVVAAATPLLQTDPVVDGALEREVAFHAPNPAIAAVVQLRQRYEPFVFDLSGLALPGGVTPRGKM